MLTPHYVETPDAKDSEEEKSMAINLFWYPDSMGLVPMNQGRRGVRRGPTILGTCVRASVWRKMSRLLKHFTLDSKKTFSRYHSTYNRIADFVTLFVRIIRASSQLWMDIILSKSVFFKIQISENDVRRPSRPLVGHQYCRAYYPYETFDSKHRNRHHNKYVNLLAHSPSLKSDWSCQGKKALSKAAHSNKEYHNCGCDTPIGQIRSIELMVMMITMASAVFIVPFSSRLINSNNETLTDKTSRQRQSTTIIIITISVIMFVCIVPLPIYYLIYKNGFGLYFDPVVN